MNSKIRNALLIIMNDRSFELSEHMYECMYIVHGNMTFYQYFHTVYSSGISILFIYKVAYHIWPRNDFQSTKIIHRENSIFKRKIAESLLSRDGPVIQENSSSYTPILFK